MPLGNIKSNIVQSIRAFRVEDLQAAAQQLGHHFLYTNLGLAQTKEEVIATIVDQFTFPETSNQSYDAIYDYITDPLHKSGPQPGFVVVLEQIPTNPKFDKEVREALLDIFRDAADYWSDRKVPFRCFYSYSVARAKREGDAKIQLAAESEGLVEIMPTDVLVDVSPLALRMSSPFNAGYWMAAAESAQAEPALA